MKTKGGKRTGAGRKKERNTKVVRVDEKFIHLIDKLEDLNEIYTYYKEICSKNKSPRYAHLEKMINDLEKIFE